ncbi:hypothetical protein GE300_03280 [Rhodobacteraceae bacterium 2CG4]|uniref:O-antigen ligase-related domain-containing protein n=1 Tax=Halovulum marinum TaxID=2662447 RepID=A0A6L5YXP6_9RHOB|nr:O-antigen ligase family protein [Halovulum marinum]MSU88642.1 hypothetical protein [Halovulum marinum]
MSTAAAGTGSATQTTGLRRLALFYASWPALGALLWLALGDSDPLRNRAPVDFLPIFELVAILMALRTGMRTEWLSAMTRPERLALALFAAVFVWTSAVAIEPLAALERAAPRLLHVFAGISLCWLLSRAAPAAGRALVGALAAQPLVHLPVLVALYLLYLDDPAHNWLGGPVGYWHVRAWGMLLAAALAAGFGLYVRARPAVAGHLAWAVILALLAGLLAFSGTRSGLLGALAGIALGAVLLPGALRRLPVLALAMAAGGALSLLPTPPTRHWGLINGLAETTAADAETRSGGRLSLWSDTIALIGERPWLGWGHDQFRYARPMPPELEVIHPHSAPLQFLFDFGLIGGLALALLLLLLWLRAIGAARREPGAGRTGALMALNALLATAMIDGALYNAETLLAVAICFAVLLASPLASAPEGG